MEKSKMTPVLITLTAPSCAGKSHLFNYIRDVARMPCLISTTTRAPRAGEVEGVDYFFISPEKSKTMEEQGEFAELAIYRGIRYGVTKTEFYGKLKTGMAFLIVEPTGIEHYVSPALEIGAKHLKYYVHTDPDVRIARLKTRMNSDIKAALTNSANAQDVIRVVNTHMDRLQSMLTHELNWGTAANWDRTLFGDKPPQSNLMIILRDVARLNARINDQHVYSFSE